MKRPDALLAILGVLALAAAPARAAAPLSDNFVTYCTVCHGEDGKGQTEKGKEKGARDFTDRKWQAAVDDARLEKSITKGRDKMPKFGDKLSPDEIKALVKEVRAFGGR